MKLGKKNQKTSVQVQSGALENVLIRRRPDGGVISAAADPVLLAAAHGRFGIAGANVEWIEAAGKIENGKPVESEGPRRYRMDVYNGGMLRIRGYFMPIIVDLAGIRAQASIANLLNHDPDQVVGHGRPVIAGNKAMLEDGVVSGVGEAPERVTKMAANGFPWRSSIGVSPERIQFVKAGEVVEANGRKFDGPCLVCRTGEWGEASFVPVGADQTSSATVAASSQEMGGEAMEFELWLKAQGIDKTKCDESALKALERMWKASGVQTPAGDASEAGKTDGAPAAAAPVQAAAAPAAAVPAVDIQAELKKLREELAKDQLRQAAVLRIVAQYRGEIGAAKAAEIEGKAMAEGWDSDKCELACVRASRVPGSIGINVGASGGGPNEAQVIEAALAMNAGVAAKNLEVDIPKVAIDAATSRKMRSFGLQALCHHVIAASGGRPTPGMFNDDTIKETFEADRRLRAAGVTTLSLSGILGNVQNKSLLQAFNAVKAVAPLVSRKANLKDFKSATTYRLVATGEIEEVPASGNVKQLIGFDEDSYSNQLKTRGTLIVIGRQHLINDDLGAFSQTGGMIGGKCVRTREKRFFTILNATGAGSSHFTSGNGNYISGATTTVGLAGYDAMYLKFRQMKHLKSKEYVDLDPVFVLVPTDVAQTARNIYLGERIVAVGLSSTSTKETEPDSNRWRNRFQVHDSPYMSDTGITGYSTTAWYMGADPAVCAFAEIGYLNGVETPQVQPVEPDMATLGVATRVIYDFEVCLAEIYGGCKSKGAS